MKTSNRIQKNSSSARTSPQGKTSDGDLSPQITESIIPAKICLECKDALRILEAVGSASAALVMLNADLIKENYNSYAGWEAFETHCFVEGSQELARMMADNFHSVIKELGGYLREIMKQIEGCNEPIQTVSRSAYFKLLEGRKQSNARIEIENAINSVNHCIEIQSSSLSLRNNPGAYALGILMKDRVDDVFKAIWNVSRDLEDAYLAATVHYDPAGTERRMAA